MKNEQSQSSLNCVVMRSDSKPGLYLYLHLSKNMEDIPEELLKRLGKYTQVMELDLDKRDKLAMVDIEVVKENLITIGYHIQFPQDLVKNVTSYH